MPRLQTLTRIASGLVTQFNPLNEVPEGALLEAQNCSIDREGVISKRRGFQRYGSAILNTAQQLFFFADRLLVHDGDNTIKYDSSGTGTWVGYSGTFLSPDGFNARIRAVQSQNSLYFTTSLGLFKTDLLTTSPVRAGMPPGLHCRPSTAGSLGPTRGWKNYNSQFSYRVIFGRIDANKRLVLGSPSFAEIVTIARQGPYSWTWSAGVVTITGIPTASVGAIMPGDIIEITDSLLVPGTSLSLTATVSAVTSSTLSFALATDPGTPDTLTFSQNSNVAFTVTIPSDIQVGDFYEIYRSENSADDITLPEDRHFKITRRPITQAQIDLKQASDFVDDIDPTGGGLGDELYTNATQETVLNANALPPFAKDICLYKNHLFFANTIKPHFLEIKLRHPYGITLDPTPLADYIQINYQGTYWRYYFSVATNITKGTFRGTSSKPTDAQQCADIMREFVFVVNNDLGLNPIQDQFYAFYVSGVDDDAGRVVILQRHPNTAPFSINSSLDRDVHHLDIGTNFEPPIPLTGDSYISDREARQNRLYHSKLQQPEAVPDLNFSDIGSAEHPISRILALRDSMIILKNGDGIWRLSGEFESQFVIKQLDPTVQIFAPETAVVLDNAVYVLTDQGVVKITESGTAIISRQVEPSIRKIQGYLLASQYCFAVAYEAERKYILFAQRASNNTLCLDAFVYNYLTQAWTTWIKPARCGITLDDRLYLGHGEDPFVIQERKNYAATGSQIGDLYADETKTITVQSVTTGTDSNGNTVSVVNVTLNPSSYEKPDRGWIFNQTISGITYPGAVIKMQVLGTNQFRLTLDRVIAGVAAGLPSSLSLGIPARVRWAPEHAKNPGIMKQFPIVQLYFENSAATIPSGLPFVYEIGFSTDLISTEQFINHIVLPSYNSDGVSLTTLLGGQVVRVPVPRDYQRSRVLNLILENDKASQFFDVLNVAYTYRPYSDRTAQATT